MRDLIYLITFFLLFNNARAETIAKNTTASFYPTSLEWALSPEIDLSAAEQLGKENKTRAAVIKIRDHSAIAILKTSSDQLFTVHLPTEPLNTAIFGNASVRIDDGYYFTAISNGSNALLNSLVALGTIFIIVSLAKKWNGNPAKEFKQHRIKIGFKDVAGHEEAKQELLEIIEFLKNPDKFSKMGARIPLGVLLIGEPGNGKTLLAKAIAGEAGVPFFATSGSDFLELFAGLGARKVAGMMKAARKRAPCLIFIDEIEALGRRGKNGGDVQSEREQTLNKFLVELDGMHKRGQVILIGATNMPHLLDPALTRTGRFDRQIVIENPTLKDRVHLLRIHTVHIKLGKVDLEEEAKKTVNFSGSDVANLVNEAAIQAVRAGLDCVDTDCFNRARDRILLGLPRSSLQLSEKEREIICYHEAGHALVSLCLPLSDPIYKISSEPRGKSLGSVIRLPEKDRVLISKLELQTMMDVGMGGRAAEEFCFGSDSITSGAGEDIKQVTKIARYMAGSYGMSDKMGRVNYLGEDEEKPSSITLAKLDNVIKIFIDQAFDRALSILIREENALHAIALELKNKGVLSGEQAMEILVQSRIKRENPSNVL